MASIFPADPDIGDVFGSYRWDGTAWMVIGVDFTTDYATYAELTSHEVDSTNVHAITNTALLETQTGAQAKATTALNSANSYTDTKVITAVPSQTGHSGKFLTTNGTLTSWGTVDLTTKANIANPTFTGTPAAPTATFGTNTTQIATTSFVQNAIQVVPINTQTASYTLTLSDAGTMVIMNVGSANNLTVPLNSSVAFAIGTQIPILQLGSGQTTVVATGGVTVASTPGLKLRTQFSSAMLIKIASDTWLLSGDIIA
jgi:hypothetical protein